MGDGQSMIRKITGFSLLVTTLVGLMPLACQPGGVGDPCTPEDEYTTTFSGYSSDETNLEARSFQCETRLCLVDHFQGRVSCRYGQGEPVAGQPANCHVPGDPNQPVTVAVSPQLSKRLAENAVYCSCRCDGPNSNARYCKCPSGFSCTHDFDDVGLGQAELVGSYCIRNGGQYDPKDPGVQCSPVGGPTATEKGTCGDADQG